MLLVEDVLEVDGSPGEGLPVRAKAFARRHARGFQLLAVLRGGD